MKKENIFRRIWGSLLTAVLAMLGFSCSEGLDDDGGNLILMYGTPTGEFQISGLVTDEQNGPVNGARVISRTYKYDGRDHETEHGYIVDIAWYNDTTFTDAKGHYHLEKRGSFPYGEVMVVVQDPSGVYESTYKEVKLDYQGNADGWYVGKAEATANFTLKKAGE